MTLGCTSRSIAAALVIGSLKIPSHWENGRWLVMSTRPASYRSASSVNSTSLSKAALLHVPQVIDQQRLEAAQLPPVAGQLQLPLGHQQLLHQQAAGRIPHPPPLLDQRVAEAAQPVGLPTAFPARRRARSPAAPGSCRPTAPPLAAGLWAAAGSARSSPAAWPPAGAPPAAGARSGEKRRRSAS